MAQVMGSFTRTQASPHGRCAWCPQLLSPGQEEVKKHVYEHVLADMKNHITAQHCQTPDHHDLAKYLKNRLGS